MVMYNLILKAKVRAGGGLDGDGYPIPPTTTDAEYKCRYRPNTQAKQINTVDGRTVVYRGTCYIPKGNLSLNTGDKITVVGHINDVEIIQVYHARFRTRIIC